ncbi:MAG: hypothetical protein KDC49_16130 [Saprospiraceae bacterium]|nr:hypothetical protein [Saprospiraceae bacterium]
MKIHTTNYYNTFIEVAEDTKADCGTEPPVKSDQKTVAALQYELIVKNPYIYTSDDVLFEVFARRNDLTDDAYPEARETFFSKGQPCLRASPLTKTYGFGVHYNAEGKIAIYGMDSPVYEQMLADEKVQKLKAMKSKR